MDSAASSSTTARARPFASPRDAGPEAGLRWRRDRTCRVRKLRTGRRSATRQQVGAPARRCAAQRSTSQRARETSHEFSPQVSETSPAGKPRPPAGTTDVIEHARPSTAESIIALRGVRKTYFRGKEPIHVLLGSRLGVPRGGYEALMGPSGSGKSTLLNLIAGPRSPDAGSLRVAGAELGAMSDSQLARWRSNTIGFIFQATT